MRHTWRSSCLVWEIISFIGSKPQETWKVLSNCMSQVIGPTKNRHVILHPNVLLKASSAAGLWYMLAVKVEQHKRYLQHIGPYWTILCPKLFTNIKLNHGHWEARPTKSRIALLPPRHDQALPYRWHVQDLLTSTNLQRTPGVPPEVTMR